MELILQGHDLRYEAEQMVLLFFHTHDAVRAVSTLTKRDGVAAVTTTVTVGTRTGEHTETAPLPLDKRACGNLIKRSAYYAMRPLSDLPTPWGILTGVRPVKIAREFLDSGLSPEAAKAALRETYLVSEEKAALCMAVAVHERRFLQDRSSVSLYIGIPFCPSRCAYCSFISGTGTHAKQADYVALLLKEWAETVQIIKELQLSVRAVYIGGGTPTALEAPLLAQLVAAVADDFGGVEFTVEAGRPDTITAEKLQILKDNAVTRISINPQTIHDKTLETIGRRHTASQFFEAYNLARTMGFNNINTDLIAGLPGEDFSMFRASLDAVCDLAPEGLTVHSLYIKRAAYMTTDSVTVMPTEAVEMLSYTQEKANAEGYMPCYMYRQKSTVGNLENIGFSKPGYNCYYNTVTMTDCTHLFALGAGGVSRLLLPEKVTRVFNYKFADEYIADFDTVLQRKRAYLRIKNQ